MIDVAPTAAVSVGASVPIATLGRDTFEPGTGMNEVAAGPSAGIDVGALLAGVVLPHISFERAWLSCDRRGTPCGAVNDVVAFSLRVTSRGQFRVFGEVGAGLRRLTTDPNPYRLVDLLFYERQGLLDNRTVSSDDDPDIRWTGIDTLRLAVGGAYAVRDELAIEAKLGCSLGSFRHVRTGSDLDLLDPNRGGYEADLREDTRKPYVIFGISLAIRGFLPVRAVRATARADIRVPS